MPATSASSTRLVGCISLLLERMPASEGLGPLVARLEDVVVDESTRGTGLGRAMVLSALDLARERGATSATLNWCALDLHLTPSHPTRLHQTHGSLRPSSAGAHELRSHVRLLLDLLLHLLQRLILLLLLLLLSAVPRRMSRSIRSAASAVRRMAQPAGPSTSALPPHRAKLPSDESWRRTLV